MNVLEKEWTDRMVQIMRIKFPEQSEDTIRGYVTKVYQARVKNTKARVYNSYEEISANTTLLDLLDWIVSKKVLLAESGVMFFPKSMKRNLNVEIIKECMLDARKIHKKEKFKAMDAGDIFLASVKDIQQLNDKKAANSGYGAEGESSSFLYNMHSAMSVTSCGRGQLSTACQCFENLLADNVKFFSVDEFYTFVYNIITEEDEWHYDTLSVIPIVPSKEEFVERFRRKFGHESLFNELQIENCYVGLTDIQRIRVYYKANLEEFLRFPKPRTLMTKIAYMEDVKFIDPNDIPKELDKPVHKLVDLIIEFVGYKYGVFRYEDRTKYQPRAVTPIMDTDSNFINFGFLLDYIREEIIPVRLKKDKPEVANARKMRILNTLAVLISTAVAKTLHHYLGKANVAEEDRPHINMKNEYYYSRVITTYAKKSYIALMMRQEAHMFDPPKLDVKGVNFFKSTASEKTSKFIYDKVLMEQLLLPKSGTPSLKDTYKTIYQFQRKITSEIAEGDMGYLKRSIKVKTADGYSNPMQIGQYKAVYIWNLVCKEKERINLPATVTLVKVKLRNKQDAAPLSSWPEIYERIMYLFDHDPNVGDYTEEDGTKKKGKGINTIALPEDYDEVPKWLLAIIDVETLVEDNMKLFTQLYRPLGMSQGSTSANGVSRKYYTNIVRI